MSNRIGFMQGRLCELVDNRIQAFPWHDWQSEFQIANKIGIQLMEWTLDQDRLYENPLLTKLGQQKIKDLCAAFRISIPSLTGDCFMQMPFWKADGDRQERLKTDFFAITRACANVGISMIVVPLVDNGSLENPKQQDILLEFLLDNLSFFENQEIKIIFESDFTPTQLAVFIGQLPTSCFGINYDIGNSAALGFNPKEEFTAYGERILNLHVKDRKLGGTTVPLTTGDADFDSVFNELARINYRGNFILQTARAVDNNHAGVLEQYRNMTADWMRIVDLY